MIILFWTNPPKDQTYKEWSESPLKFSYFHELVLKAHEKLGNKVQLWSYQKGNIPYENIELLDANRVFSRIQAYESLKSGHVVAILSDAVRIMQASAEKGIIVQ